MAGFRGYDFNQMRMLKRQDVEVGQRDAFRRVVQHEQGGYLVVTEKVCHGMRHLRVKRAARRIARCWKGWCFDGLNFIAEYRDSIFIVSVECLTGYPRRQACFTHRLRVAFVPLAVTQLCGYKAVTKGAPNHEFPSRWS